MQWRTYLGILLGIVVVVAVAFFTGQNRELLAQPFQVTQNASVPVYLAVLAIFLIGFLPTATILFMQSLERDLAQRRVRKRHLEIESVDGRFRRAIDLQADGQLANAAAQFEDVLTERPEDFDALLRYGQVLREQGRHDEALEVHRRASVLYPQSVALLLQLADDYQALDQGEVAAEIRNRILRDFTGQGWSVMRRRRDLALAAGNWEDAARWQDRLTADDSEPTDADAGAGVSHGLSYQRGVSLLEKDRIDEAITVFRKLLEQEARFIPAGIMLGEAELLRNDPEAALDAWREGFKSTGSPVYLQRIEDHFIEAEAPVRAIETLRTLIATAENDLLLRFFLGRLYYRIEMPDEALKVLEGLGEAMDSSPAYHYLLGRIHQRRDHTRRALASYRTCLQRLGVHGAGFRCRACGERYESWLDRCTNCGAWNAVELDVEDEQISAEDLGMLLTPVWGAAVTEA